MEIRLKLIDNGFVIHYADIDGKWTLAVFLQTLIARIREHCAEYIGENAIIEIIDSCFRENGKAMEASDETFESYMEKSLSQGAFYIRTFEGTPFFK
jgi:hypothetical protein